MGPKTFTACYVCLKEFGSKSIALHEPLCLNRWRASNKNLPADKRSSTPVKNADKNQNNPSWACSHCRDKRSPDGGTTSSSKRKSSSPKEAQSHCAKLVKSERVGEEYNKSRSPKQVRPDCAKSVKCGEESLLDSCTKLGKCSEEYSRSRSPQKGRLDRAKSVKNADESVLDCCTKVEKCGDECTRSRSPRKGRFDSDKSVKCSVESQLDCCTRLGKCGGQSKKSSSPKLRMDCANQVKRGNECSKSRSDCCAKLAKCGDEYYTPKQLSSDCAKLLKSVGESTSCFIKHIHSDRLKGLSSPKEQSKSSIPKQVPPDCVSMTGVAKPEFSPKKGKENKNNNNNNNHIPPPSVLRKNAKNDANSNDPKEDPPDETEISFTSRRSVRPQTKILRRPTPNLNHPVIQQVDSDDSSSSDKSKEDDNPKRIKMEDEEEDPTAPHKPKNFIIYNKNNVDRKLKSKDAPRERNSATLQTAIPNPCNSCNRSLAPERLHSHAKKDSRGLMYRKSPTLDVKMSSPQKKLEDLATKSNSKVTASKLPKAVPVTPDRDKQVVATLRVPGEESSKSEDLSSEDVSSSEEKDLVDLEKSCYICQKEFKVSALLLHESKCLESWKKTNNSLTPNLRKLPPRRPDEPSSEDPVWTSVQSQLVPCASCGRTFFPERLPVHRRVCKGKPSPRALKRTSSLREHSASSSEGDGPRPAAVYVPCYVCGRSYGSWVISMHEQQCIRRWRGENQKLPDEEQKEEPAKPERQEDEDVTSLVELGDNAWESHLQQLVPCPLCTRTFFPDRLGVHKRSCKGPSNGARRPKSNKGA